MRGNLLVKYKFGVVFLFMLFFLSTTVYSWWSEPNNTHYRLTLMSKNLLSRMGLLFDHELRNGANEPDRIEGLKKVLEHHRHFHRVEINFNSAVNLYRRRNNKGAAWVLASAFHYLQDAIDFSTMFSEDYRNGIRSSCHNILGKWNEVMQQRGISSFFQRIYLSEKSTMRYFSLRQVVRRTQSMRNVLGREMRYHLNRLEQSSIDSESYYISLTKVVLKAVAILKAGQARIIELLWQAAYRRR